MSDVGTNILIDNGIKKLTVESLRHLKQDQVMLSMSQGTFIGRLIDGNIDMISKIEFYK